MSLPTAAEREAALRARCDGMPLDEDSLDLGAVAHACSGYAAADLIGLAREAMLSAARRQLTHPTNKEAARSLRGPPTSHEAALPRTRGRRRGKMPEERPVRRRAVL